MKSLIIKVNALQTEDYDPTKKVLKAPRVVIMTFCVFIGRRICVILASYRGLFVNM